MRNKKFLTRISVFAELAKIRVTLLVTFTTATGYFLFSTIFTFQFLFAVLGIFILASGSAALNQVQEMHIDKIMPRTQKRPIPSGRINPTSAIIFSLILIFTGCIMLFFGAGTVPFLLGIFTLFWYNGIYTNLKRITAFAVVPGSIVGAIPPIVGWTAAGGIINDFQILSLAFYLFIWQIPHFWLLLIIYGKDYEIAGLPTLTNIFSTSQIKRLTFVWIFATISVAVLVALFSSFYFPYFIVIIILSMIVFVLAMQELFFKQELTVKLLFIIINSYTLLFLILCLLNSY